MATEETSNEIFTTHSIQLIAEDFDEFGAIPEDCLYDRANRIPRFVLTGVPRDCKALAFVVIDEDAPGKAMIHHIVWNIDPNSETIDQESLLTGTKGKNSWMLKTYHGSTPLKQRHYYSFSVYALPVCLDLDPNSDPEHNLTIIKNIATDMNSILAYVSSAEDFAIE